MSIKDESSDGESSQGESSQPVVSLAERRRRWELPPHLLPKNHPRYKPLENDVG